MFSADRAVRERDFYRRLLALDAQEEVEPFVEEALALIVAISGARRGYLELSEERDEGGSPRFWMAHGCYDDEVAEIRAAFSRGVIGETLRTGQTVTTASAREDPRFFALASVQRNATGAVLCAPIGDDPPVGVVYLQDRAEPGDFDAEDREHVETFACRVAAVADRLLARRRRREGDDATAPFRRTIRADGFIGRSPAIAAVLKQIAQVAPTEASVLLLGPNGTGKTQLARVVHESSPRRKGPFVVLNCGLLVDTLAEAQLFGTVQGAFTGARDMEGKVAAADGGTLFLDDVGELELPVQAKLLQFLQSKEYSRVGASKPVRRADVRIIAATNVDLRAAIANKAFREDLFYRLQVLAIHVPPLSERPEDLADLAEHFAARACAQNRLPPLLVSSGAQRAIAAAEWPGNARELGNAMEAAAIRAAWEGAAQIERAHVFPDAGVAAGAPVTEMTLQEATRRFQRGHVRAALRAAGWNVVEASRRLDISRAQVYKLIQELGIERPRG